MARRDPHIEPVGDVLEKSLKRLDLAARLDEYGVWPIWNEIVGKPIARNAQPEKIRNGTLFVKVSSPVWMQQLQYMKEAIADKLNQRLRAKVVKNIFFVIGGIDEAAGNQPEPAPDDRPAAPAVDESFLDSIADPEIRQAFKKLLKSYSRRRKNS